MGKEIMDKLHGIEQENNITILLAVESGSRAWGFESKNSDWDVRFIYVHKPEWYFMVEPQRDVIELMEGDIDIVGWELRKALALLKRSNPSLLEWIHSPIVYYADEEFMGRMQCAATQFYNPIASMYHYNRMFNKHNQHYLQRENCDMKRFLYYLRGILACKWIEANKTLPPVKFDELVNATIEYENLRTRIDDLIRMKKKGEEHGLSVVDSALMDYARNLADHYNEKIGDFISELRDRPSTVLDAILYDMVFSHNKDNQQQKMLISVSKESQFIPRASLDWTYDQDKQRNFKFKAGNTEHLFRQGDRVCLIVYGRQNYQFGNIIMVGEDYIIVHTEEWLDISEEYTIRLIK